MIEPVILVEAKSKKHTLGTCSNNPIWQHKEKDQDKRYEITLSGNHLNRTLEQLVTTLLHEMIHLYCSLNNIKDTSNNCVYHNKRFKQEAEQRGLKIEKDKIIGWSISTLQDFTKELIKTFKIDNTAFEYWRNSSVYKIERPKVVLNKYKCSDCSVKISSTKKLNLICGDCNKKLVLIEEI